MNVTELMQLPNDTLITATVPAVTLKRLNVLDANWGILLENTHVADTPNPTLPFSWDEAPEWAKYAAQDRNGAWYFFDRKPEQEADFWAPFGATYAPVEALNWQQTLTQRPTCHPSLVYHFPNFSEPGLDNVFPEWTPTHYRNDVSPSYEITVNADMTVKLWVHDRDRSKREEDSYERFLIEVLKDEWKIVCFSDENMTGLMSKMSWYLVTRGSDVQAVLQMNLIELARAVGLVSTN